MEKQILELFGSEFIENVRDMSLRKFENLINGKMKSEESFEIQEFLQNIDSNNLEYIKKIIFEMTDTIMHNTLFMFEANEEFLICKNSEEGLIDVNELSDGLSGELYSKNGWINKFSKYKTLNDIKKTLET